MVRAVASNASALLLGVVLLLLGSGLLGTLLALRGDQAGFGTGTLGLVMSAYFVGFFVGTLWVPGLIGRIGHIRAFSMFASLASVTAIVHGLWVTPWAWALGRVITGICLVGLYTVIESWLNAQASSEQRGRLFAVYMALNLLALAAGQGLILLQPDNPLVLFGLVSILFSIALVPVTLTRTAQPEPIRAPRLGLRALYRSAPVGVVGAFASGLMLGGFWGMGPVLAQQLGMDRTGIALLMSLTILGGAALQWPLGHWSDRTDRRRVIATASLVTALVTAAAAWNAGPGWPVLVAMFVFGGGAFSLYSISVAHLIDFVSQDAILEASSGLLLVYGVGAAIGPTAAGLLMTGLGAAGLLLFFAVTAASLAVFALYRIRLMDRIASHPLPFVALIRTSPGALDIASSGEDRPQDMAPTPEPPSTSGKG